MSRLPETEADFQRWVIDLAKLHHWRVHHARPVRLPSGRHATPIQGHRGAPDLLLARNGVVILAELKQDGRYPDPEQRAWRDAIGPQWRLWRPADRAVILATLVGA